MITSKPLVLLDILAKKDLNLKQAAKELNITLNTANKHIASAKQALGVNTQAAAVYRAVKQGLIKLEDE